MADFWNFHASWYVAEQNWFWLLVTLGIGIVVGWMVCEPEPRKPREGGPDASPRP
jgi:hypothetical protein